MEFIQQLISFEGRVNRKDYWLIVLPLGLLSILNYSSSGPKIYTRSISGQFYEVVYTQSASISYYVFALLLGIPLCSIIVRRLHDLDRQTTWILFPLVPYLVISFSLNSQLVELAFGILFLSLMLLLELGVREGDRISNNYGPPPGDDSFLSKLLEVGRG